MKKLVFLMALFCSLTAHAQLPSQGSWLVGAEVGELEAGWGRTNVRRSSISLTPLAGYFITNRFVLGAGIPLGASSYELGGQRTNTSIVGIEPFFRYYLNDQQLRPYLTGGLGFVNQSSRINEGPTSTTRSFSGNLGLGLGYFISRNVSFDGVLRYQYTNDETGPVTANTNGINLKAGFSIFLGR